MSKPLVDRVKTMGTLPVFMTAISTILGAILFLKFGYAMGHVGLIGTLGIIVLGHMVTIPTALAVAEIATNQKVEGGGAYYIISRSFGMNIGGAIGIALYLAQGISVAFYIIAFGEAADMLRMYIQEQSGYHFTYPIIDTYFKTGVNFASMTLLALVILTRGANIGMKALYFVVAILIVSLGMFFIAQTNYTPTNNIFATISDTSPGVVSDKFFYVFAVIFPAFTGIAAGLGLSGDLKEPRKSIPKGTLWATLTGILVYTAVAIKLYYSASPEDLANEENIIMAKLTWGPTIAIGLACAAISSALGSVMIAPRTLQALGTDKVFPGTGLNSWLGKGRDKDNEPINASLITCVIAFLFLLMGDINAVAEIISMFFMVTYGAICMVSFFEHFAADPAYRPTFRSRWYISLLGGVLCFWLMFKMNTGYAIGSIALMVGIYAWITSKKNDKSGLENLFKGVIFQLSRSIQVFLQRRDTEAVVDKWRPFVITLSSNSFKRNSALKMTSWISYKYGFGTYLHFIKGDFSRPNQKLAEEFKTRLLKLAEGLKSRVYLDTIVSIDEKQAIQQTLQLPSVSGQPNNMVLFEYPKNEINELQPYVDNHKLVESIAIDTCILRTTNRGFGYNKSIHIWITTTDTDNSNLMILLGYIILGHPDWKNAEIKIFSIFKKQELEEKTIALNNLIKAGRLPISQNNIQIITSEKESSHKDIINEHSEDADLTIIGFNDTNIKKKGIETFTRFDKLGDILFVNASELKEIQ